MINFIQRSDKLYGNSEISLDCTSETIHDKLFWGPQFVGGQAHTSEVLIEQQKHVHGECTWRMSFQLILGYTVKLVMLTSK